MPHDIKYSVAAANTVRKSLATMRIVSVSKSPPHDFQLSWVIWCLSIGLAFVVILRSFFSFDVADANCVGLLGTFMLLSYVLAYKLVQWRPQFILTPLPWFLLASGAYFGLGPLVYFFGADAAIAYCQAVFPVTVEDLIRVTISNLAGVTIVFCVWFWMTRRVIQVKSLRVRPDDMTRAMVVFYLIGIPFRLVIILSSYHLIEFTVPGFLTWLANFTSAGLVLLTTMAFRRGGVWWLILGAMFTMDVVAAMGVFSKLPIILSVLPCVFGYLLYRPGVKALPWILVFIGCVYLASNSYVTYCRKHGLGQEISMSTRMELGKSFFDSDRNEVEDVNATQNWWTRLNYANVQSFAMREFDYGSPGDSVELALIAPIPRILWPEKPIIESGTGLYKRLTGQESASFGIGFFTEAYWNGGWWYVILSAAAIGWVFGTVTLAFAKEQSVGNLWVLPISLLWVRSGARVDGWMHTEIVGPAVFTLIFIGIMRLWRPATSAKINKRSSRRRRLRKDAIVSRCPIEEMP